MGSANWPNLEIWVMTEVIRSKLAGKPKPKKSNPEILRRVILGELRRVFRGRYGPVLPDDNAGREDIELLLYPLSLHPTHPIEQMKHAIETIAPWMPPAEAKPLIDSLMDLPIWYRKLSPREMGYKIRLTNAEREKYKAWHILPVDMTDEELAKHKRAKERARGERRRRKAGAKPQAGSKSKLQPWIQNGVSRANYFRNQRRLRETDSSEVLASNGVTLRLSDSHPLESLTPTPKPKPSSPAGPTDVGPGLGLETPSSELLEVLARIKESHWVKGVSNEFTHDSCLGHALGS